MDRMEGKLIRLRPPKEEDYEFFAALKNDLRTQAWNQRLPMRATVKTVAKWVEKEYERPDCGTWSIETLDGELVGHIGYSEGPLRFAASIGVITGVDFWGKGYSQEAHELMLEFLFEERGIQVVRLWTQASGERGLVAAQKLGFKIGARFREGSVIGGKSVDGVYMDMLREEYYKSRGKKDNLPPVEL
ncbi:MAG: GNAT family N-acetyltransferase [Thermoplasmata archaeon]|nr:GNAT family N-acetyltransferase [Thermoplasmata archaeon]